MILRRKYLRAEDGFGKLIKGLQILAGNRIKLMNQLGRHLLEIILQGPGAGPAATPSNPWNIFAGSVEEGGSTATEHAWRGPLFAIVCKECQGESSLDPIAA